MENFEPTILSDLLKEKENESFALKKFEMSENDIAFERMRDAAHGRYETHGIKPGTYVRLIDKRLHATMMSNTPMELNTNYEFISKAKGNVLIAGLGIGMVLLAIQDKPEIKRIVVAEKYQEVIDLVKPQLPLNQKVSIRTVDIFDFDPDEKFDTIYFDIWNNICGDNWSEMKKLHASFRKNLAVGGWMGSWRKEDCQRLDKE